MFDSDTRRRNIYKFLRNSTNKVFLKLFQNDYNNIQIITTSHFWMVKLLKES